MRTHSTRIPRLCAVCAGPYIQKGWAIGKRCGRCDAFIQKAYIRAHRIVGNAVRRGRLVAARTLSCVDCGKAAAVYDHRDYDRPLEVQPVCVSCNWHRGPAVQGQPKHGVAA